MSRHCTVKVELIGNRLFPTLFIDVSFSKSTYSSNFWPNMNGSICFYFQEIGFRYSLANFTLETLKSDFVFFFRNIPLNTSFFDKIYLCYFIISIFKFDHVTARNFGICSFQKLILFWAVGLSKIHVINGCLLWLATGVFQFQ